MSFLDPSKSSSSSCRRDTAPATTTARCCVIERRGILPPHVPPFSLPARKQLSSFHLIASCTPPGDAEDQRHHTPSLQASQQRDSKDGVKACWKQRWRQEQGEKEAFKRCHWLVMLSISWNRLKSVPLHAQDAVTKCRMFGVSWDWLCREETSHGVSFVVGVMMIMWRRGVYLPDNVPPLLDCCAEGERSIHRDNLLPLIDFTS